MTPSEVRKVVLDGHEKLAVLLDAVDGLSAQQITAPSADSAELRERVVALTSELSQHLDLEDEILKPVLRTIDAWGQARVEKLETEHGAQRLELVALRDMAKDPASAVSLAHAARKFAMELREDMANEEATLLHPDLLRDDIFHLDHFGG